MIYSIMQDMNEPRCFITGQTYNLDKHHIMNGAFRKKSEEHGLIIYLQHDIHMWLHHTGEGKKAMKELKKNAQLKWEELHRDDYEDVRKEWVKLFKTNYVYE